MTAVVKEAVVERSGRISAHFYWEGIFQEGFGSFPCRDHSSLGTQPFPLS